MKSFTYTIRKFQFLLIICMFLGLLFPLHSLGQVVLEDSVMNGGNFEKAAFRLSFNEDIKTIRGIIVLVPGSNSDGRDKVNDVAWQDLARQHDFALLGCYFTDKQHEHMAIEEYVNVGQGSGQALLDILQNFAKMAVHPELEFAPLALWGMSAGGEFNYEFACWKPERVLAFVVNKGGVYYTSLASAQTWQVPGVFFTGTDDSPYRSNTVKGIFSINRRFGAKWIFVEEEGVNHEIGKSKEFVLFYFDKIIPLRVSPEKIDSFYTLNNIKSPGYIGVLPTKKIAHETEYKGQEIISWFPNKEIADKWLEIIE